MEKVPWVCIEHLVAKPFSAVLYVFTSSSAIAPMVGVGSAEGCGVASPRNRSAENATTILEQVSQSKSIMPKAERLHVA